MSIKLTLPLFAILLGAGCATSSEYGIRQDPALRAAEGKETVAEAEKEIERENREALERGDESMFQTERE